jgi:hypothetical protein
MYVNFVIILSQKLNIICFVKIIYIFLIKSYLENRYQTVILNDKCSNNNVASNWGTVNHDVPQGSIPRPLLFTVYERYT